MFSEFLSLCHQRGCLVEKLGVHLQALERRKREEVRGVFEDMQRRAFTMLGEAGTETQYLKLIAVFRTLAGADGDRKDGGRKRAVLACARILLNALPTSARAQAAAAPCLFGCPGERDSTSHYFRCRRARRIVAVATVAPPPSPVDLEFAIGGVPCETVT